MLDGLRTTANFKSQSITNLIARVEMFEFFAFDLSIKDISDCTQVTPEGEPYA